MCVAHVDVVNKDRSVIVGLLDDVFEFDRNVDCAPVDGDNVTKVERAVVVVAAAAAAVVVVVQSVQVDNEMSPYVDEATE
jgi:hypothetical protein